MRGSLRTLFNPSGVKLVHCVFVDLAIFIKLTNFNNKIILILASSNDQQVAPSGYMRNIYFMPWSGIAMPP